MKHTHKKLPNSIIELEVILDHKEFLDYYQPVHDRELSHVHLKGFRPGTAPKEMAEQAVDKEKVFEEAVNNAARDNLQEITGENNWQLIDQPRIEVLDTNPAAGIGLKYKATLTIFPEVKLGNYKKIARQVLAEKKEVKATDEEMSQAIQWILKSRAKSDGSPSTGSGLPELTDEFAKTLGNFSSAEELKNSVRKGLEQEKNSKEKERINLKLLEGIREASSFDLPKIMVEKTLNNLLAEYGPMADAKENKEELRAKLEKEAEISVKNNLILYQIAKDEKLEPGEEEVKKEADLFLAHSQFSKHPKIDPQRVYDYIYGIVQNKKVFEYLESLK